MDFKNICQYLRGLRRRGVHALLARLWVVWLSLINRYARAPVCGPDGPVVSMTTHGDRVLTVHLTVESIGRGELRPSRLILWLDDAVRFKSLPLALRRLQKRGLEVKLSKNYGPHTKYYPYIECEESITQPLVTADDDILYPRLWLSKLADANRRFPDSINCYRARVVTVREGEVVPYGEWEMCTCTEASFRYLATGVSGVIYSPEFLKDIKASGDVFKDCCPKADDLWLHVQALRSGRKIKQIGKRAIHFPRIPGTQKACLFGGNVVSHDGNDRQLKSTYTQEDFAVLLRDYKPGISETTGSHIFTNFEIAGGD